MRKKPKEKNTKSKQKRDEYNNVLKKIKLLVLTVYNCIYRYYNESELPYYFCRFTSNDDNEKVENEKILNETTLTTETDIVDLDPIYNDSFKNAEFNSIAPYKKKKIFLNS